MFIAKPNWPDQFTLPMVFFGSADGGHAYLLMDGRDRTNNKVFLWEQASDPFGTGNNARGLNLVAPTLFEFFYNLKMPTRLNVGPARKMAFDLLEAWPDSVFALGLPVEQVTLSEQDRLAIWLDPWIRDFSNWTRYLNSPAISACRR